MSAVKPTGEWDGSVFAHEGFVFGTDSELTSRVLPFIDEGLSRDEPVLVVAGERVRQILLDNLGSDIARLASFEAAEDWWQGGHETIAAYDRDLRVLRSQVPSWRLVGEPVWIGENDGREWSRFESAANEFYADMPYYSLCLHDEQLLSTDAITEIRRTHPLQWDGFAPVPMPTYENPAAFVASVAPAWTPRPEHAEVVTVLSVRDARRVISNAVLEGWSARAEDIALAVHELVANALREAGTAEVASWTAGDQLVLEVSDAGQGLADPLRGYAPPAEHFEGGRGMWLAWRLADDAASVTSCAGTSIRVFFRRG